jgi:hypothetical protein
MRSGGVDSAILILILIDNNNYKNSSPLATQAALYLVSFPFLAILAARPGFGTAEPPPILHNRVLTAKKEMSLGLVVARAQRAPGVEGLVSFPDVPAMRLLVINMRRCSPSSL